VLFSDNSQLLFEQTRHPAKDVSSDYETWHHSHSTQNNSETYIKGTVGNVIYNNGPPLLVDLFLYSYEAGFV
jgi:hypothetical protein